MPYTGNDAYLDRVNPSASTSTSSSGASSSNPPSSGGGTSAPSAPSIVVTVTAGAIPLFSCTQLTSNPCSLERALQATSIQKNNNLRPVLAALSQQTLSNACTALNAIDSEIYADADWLALHQVANLRRLIDRHPYAPVRTQLRELLQVRNLPLR